MSQSSTEFICQRRADCALGEAVQRLADEFAMLDDWEERYQFLIELGDELPEMPEQFKRPDFEVEGCMSTVWLVVHPSSDDPPVMTILADSDAAIVRGLIAVLLEILNGRTPEEILGCDLHCVFDRLDLREHLSVSRRNGLQAMINRVHVLAEQYA